MLDLAIEHGIVHPCTTGRAVHRYLQYVTPAVRDHLYTFFWRRIDVRWRTVIRRDLSDLARYLVDRGSEDA